MKTEEKIEKEKKTLWYKGYNYFLKGEYEKARKFYNEAISKEYDGTGYLMLGILNNKLKKYDEAIENFNKYAEFSVKAKSIAYGYRGLTKLKLGFYNDAFNDFMFAIKFRVEIKKIEHNNNLNNLLEIIGTYNKIDLNNNEKNSVNTNRINKKIDNCFSVCISCIENDDFEDAIEYLQELLQMYQKLISPENKENKWKS